MNPITAKSAEKYPGEADKRHHNYFVGFYGEWTIILMIFGFLILIAACIWLLHRRTVASDGLTPKERETLSTQEREIISLLRQNGGPMRQDQMIDMLPGSLEMVSEILHSMETKGIIARKWVAEQGTFTVSA